MRSATGGTEAAAIETVVEMRDRATVLLLGLRTRLMAGLPPLSGRCVGAVGNLVRGSLEWHHRTDRYRSGAADEAPRMPWGITDVTPDVSLDPLPIPSIAWWWQVSDPARPG